MPPALPMHPCPEAKKKVAYLKRPQISGPFENFHSLPQESPSDVGGGVGGSAGAGQGPKHPPLPPPRGGGSLSNGLPRVHAVCHSERRP